MAGILNIDSGHFPAPAEAERFPELKITVVSNLLRNNTGPQEAAAGKEMVTGQPDEITLDSSVVTAELLEALRGGDHEAYEVVYKHYREMIGNYLCKLLQSREEAEEIAQNVFMTLWERRSELDPTRNIRTLLYTVARNAVMNQFKREKVLRKYEKSTAPDDTENLTAEDILIAQEHELLVELAVENMPEMRRKVFEMSRQQNMSHEDIAQHLDTSKHNVANHLSQALKQLKHVLKH